MEINNKVHRDLVEETGDFQLAESLGLQYCGACAVFGPLTLVSQDATTVRHHEHPGGGECQTFPVCHECLESVDWAPTPNMSQCTQQGCLSAVEDWREEQAALKAPLFYGYEAYSSAYSSPVTIVQDIRLADTLRPAGDIRAFTTGEGRDAWVEDGPTPIKNEFGYIVKYRARSAISAEAGSRLHIPADEDIDAHG